MDAGFKQTNPVCVCVCVCLCVCVSVCVCVDPGFGRVTAQYT